MPVDTPDGFNTACRRLPNVHWVGFEVQNFTVGVKVSGGTINHSSLTLEFYNINLDDTCTFITEYSIQLPSSGSRWENVDVQLPQDSQIGVRIRVDGDAPYDATIDVYVAARYKKTVDNLAQIATSKATTRSSFIVTASNRDKIAILFGPYVAYDGLAATSEGTSYSYINVPSHTVRLRWTGQYCPMLRVEYQVNGIAYTTRFVSPSTSSPANGYCRYDVPSTVLQLRARAYAISKAQSRGGEITISIVYDVRGSPDVTISFNNNLEIIYHRWIEPFHSNYIDRAGYPYLEWAVMLLRGTYQVFDLTSLNITSEIRISHSQIALSLAHNQLDPTRHICGAEWTITVPVSRPGVYYGDRWIEEPLWARLGRGMLLNTVGWLIALGYNTVFSIVVNVVYNIFQTASGSVSVDSSNGVYTVRWIKGWAEPPPPTVVILLNPASSPPSRHAEWKYFREGHSAFPWACIVAIPRDVNTNIYLPSAGARQWALAKIWTWRGQTFVSTNALTIHAR